VYRSEYFRRLRRDSGVGATGLALEHPDRSRIAYFNA
jgi:hypothetical protein